MHLNARQTHEVLGDVNNKFVHESRGNVETIHVVVEVVSAPRIGLDWIGDKLYIYIYR